MARLSCRNVRVLPLTRRRGGGQCASTTNRRLFVSTTKLGSGATLWAHGATDSPSGAGRPGSIASQAQRLTVTTSEGGLCAFSVPF